MRLLKLEWSNTSDLGSILYSDGFVNKIWLDVEVERPDYETTIESEANGDNEEIPKFKKHEKVYKFELWATEDLIDAFEMMQLCNTITATLQTGQIINVTSLIVEPEWIEMGCLAKLTVSMKESYVITTACNENMAIDVPCDCLAPISAGPIPIADKGTTSGTAGDIILFYTAEVIAGCKYTGHLWELGTTGLYDWVDLGAPVSGTCIEGPGSVKYVFDGQYWQLYPGYFTDLQWTGAGELTATGYVLPYMFVTLYYRTPADPPTGPGGGVWSISGNSYTAAEFAAGIVKTGCAAQSYDVKATVWNHSCNYGDTDLMAIAAP